MNKAERKQLNLAKAEASKFAKYGKEQPFYVGVLNSMDKDKLIDLPEAVVNSALEEFRKRAPNTGVMLITAGNNTLRVVVDIHSSNVLHPSTWVNALNIDKKDIKECKVDTFPRILNHDDPKEFTMYNFLSRIWNINEGEGFKLPDIVKGNAFNYLKEHDLLPPDEESDDELVFGDEMLE